MSTAAPPEPSGPDAEEEKPKKKKAKRQERVRQPNEPPAVARVYPTHTVYLCGGCTREFDLPRNLLLHVPNCAAPEITIFGVELLAPEEPAQPIAPEVRWFSHTEYVCTGAFSDFVSSWAREIASSLGELPNLSETIDALEKLLPGARKDAKELSEIVFGWDPAYTGEAEKQQELQAVRAILCLLVISQDLSPLDQELRRAINDKLMIQQQMALTAIFDSSLKRLNISLNDLKFSPRTPEVPVKVYDPNTPRTAQLQREHFIGKSAADYEEYIARLATRIAESETQVKKLLVLLATLGIEADAAVTVLHEKSELRFSVSMVRHDLNSNYNRIAELEADVERARVKEMEWAHMEDELEILRTELHAEKQKVRNLQKNQKDYAQLAEQAADREERLTQEMRENAKAAKEIERLRRELEQARQLAEEQQRAADELRARIDALAAEAAAAGAAPPLRTAAETSSQPKEAAPQPQLTSSSASFAAVAAGGDAAEAPVTVQVEGGGIDLTIRVAQLQKMLTEKTIENERLRLCGIDHAKGVERIKSLKVANRKLHEQFAARVERERETRLELQTEPVSKSLDEIIVGGLELRRDYLSLKHGVSSGKASTAFSASGAFSPRYTSNDETHHNLTFCTSTSRLTALRERSIEVPDSISPGVASHVPAYKNA
ncbi:hypothetical protein DIPPA_28639 [Diplonema papillatum]|nr:hypothetical protein DIPPA_28639 [Diplonema papillatum]